MDETFEKNKVYVVRQTFDGGLIPFQEGLVLRYIRRYYDRYDDSYVLVFRDEESNKDMELFLLRGQDESAVRHLFCVYS